jgi:hypothetical protein
MEVVSVQKIISRGALLFLFVAVLSLIIFLSGCGGGGAGSGMSALNGDNMSATQGSSKELKTQQALPQNTLAFIEEEGKRYKEYLSQVKSDSNYPGPLLDFTNNSFIQNGTRTSRDTYDPEKYLCLPNGSVYYSLNGTPFMGSNGPLIFLATYTSTGDRKEIPLTGITAKKAHFLVFAGCSPDVPNRHVGTITMLYKDGTTNQLELTMGTNVAEWAYDRPELQGHILHSKVPSGYDFSTTAGSNYQYNGHFFYVSIDLQEKELTSMALSMDSDMHQQGDRYFDLNIAGMTLELKSSLSIENLNINPNPFNTYITPYKTKITADIVSTSSQQDPSPLSWEVVIYDSNGSTIKHFPDGQGNKVSVEWDGKDDLGKYIFYTDTTEQKRTIDNYIKEANYTVKINAKDNSSNSSDSKTDSLKVCHYILDVIQFLQNDERWGNKILDHLDEPSKKVTIGARGCALSSFCMLASFYSSNPENPNFYPSYVNDWLKLNNGYTNKGSLKWGKIKEFSNYNNGISHCEFLGFADTSVILSDIFSEKPVILFLPYGSIQDQHTHFTVCKGKVGEQYLLSDSVNRDFMKSWEPFYDAVSALRFQKTTISDQSKDLAFYGEDETGGSVQYAITDPQGRYLGYDPSNGKKIEQVYIIQGSIPDAQYAYLPLTGVDSNDFIGKTKILWLYKPIDGTYNLKVFGIDASEHYYVDVEGGSQDGDSISLSGYLVPGQSDEYTIDFSQSPGSELLVTQKNLVLFKANFKPETLDFGGHCHEKYIEATIKLPRKYDADDVIMKSILLEDSIPALLSPSQKCHQNKLTMKFDRITLLNYLKSKGIKSGKVSLTITGRIGNKAFKATDRIRIKK